MTPSRSPIIVAIAFANSAQVQAWRMSLSGEEREHSERTLRNLSELGHIAAFSFRSAEEESYGGFVGELRSHLGHLTVDACLTAASPARYQPPSFLAPIWAFDHAGQGAPSSTGQLLGLNLELIAMPSRDEEFGAYLPGRTGRWLIHAHPMF